MADYFLDDLQLNDSVVQCGLTEISVSKNFNNAVYERYQQVHPMVFGVSGGPQSYGFELTLWRAGGIGAFTDLLNREQDIYDKINNQVKYFSPILFRSDVTPVLFNYNNVRLLFDDADYNRRATDGNNFVTLKFSCVSLGPSLSELGTIGGIASGMVAGFMVGGG